MAEENPWIEWKGKGAPPVSQTTVHDVRYRDGDEVYGTCGPEMPDWGWRIIWKHTRYGRGADIIAYRIVTP